jgi:hypothetical protein
MISKIRFNNCFCYRGEYELSLDARVYAITAKYEGEEGRSNWSGKSSLMKLLGSMPLFGDHDAGLEDDWITNGEESAYYEIELDTGQRIRRSRIRGKTTQVQLFDGDKKVGQKGAQAEIEALVGLSEKDFNASCYFKQKEIDKLISLDPAPRQALVMSWLDLNSLKSCETKAKEELSSMVSSTSQLETLIKEYESGIQKTLEAVGLQSIDNIEPELKSVNSRFEVLVKQAEEANKMATKAASLQMEHGRCEEAAKEIEELNETVIDLLTSRTEYDISGLENIEQEYLQARLDNDKAQTEVHRLQVLAEGEFDGACPVSKGFQCPAKAFINSDRLRHAEALKECLHSSQGALRAESELKERLRDLRDAAAVLARIDGQIVRIRKRITVLQAYVDKPLESVPYGDFVEQAETLNREVGQLQSRNWALTKVKKDVGQMVAELAGRRAELEAKLLVKNRLLEEVSIFKLAQTKCAEEGLAEIEDGANDLLTDAGLDLTVKVKWNKEGQGLSKHCDVCGETYPPSTKVRSCPKCNSPRGQHSIEKLLVELSDRSGGAEDLAGLALQLSAAAFLRSKRGSNWDVVYLDEIAGSLDAANRKALGTHISKMITGRFGFKQGFIVSHSPELDEMFSGRIEILVKKDGTRTISVS